MASAGRCPVVPCPGDAATAALPGASALPSLMSPYLDEGVGLDALGILHRHSQPAGRGQAGGVVLEVHGPQEAGQVPGIVQAGGQRVALAAGGRLGRERHGRTAGPRQRRERRKRGHSDSEHRE